MPQLVVLALVGAGLYAGYRWLSRSAKQIAAEVRRTEDELLRRATGRAIEKDMGRLEYDPVSGVYRPAQRDYSEIVLDGSETRFHQRT